MKNCTYENHNEELIKKIQEKVSNHKGDNCFLEKVIGFTIIEYYLGPNNLGTQYKFKDGNRNNFNKKNFLIYGANYTECFLQNEKKYIFSKGNDGFLFVNSKEKKYFYSYQIDNESIDLIKNLNIYKVNSSLVYRDENNNHKSLAKLILGIPSDCRVQISFADGNNSNYKKENLVIKNKDKLARFLNEKPRTSKKKYPKPSKKTNNITFFEFDDESCYIEVKDKKIIFNKKNIDKIKEVDSINIVSNNATYRKDGQNKRLFGLIHNIDLSKFRICYKNKDKFDLREENLIIHEIKKTKKECECCKKEFSSKVSKICCSCVSYIGKINKLKKECKKAENLLLTFLRSFNKKKCKYCLQNEAEVGIMCKICAYEEENITVQFCRKCKQLKDKSKFYKNRTPRKKGGFFERKCRDCFSKDRIDSFKKDPFKRVLANLRKDSRKRKAPKGLKIDLKAKDWRFAIKFFNNMCAYCGENPKTKGNKFIEKDHVIPQSKMGPTIPENIIPTCGECNVKKSNKDLDEWLSELDDKNNIAMKIAAYLDKCRISEQKIKLEISKFLEKFL